MNIPVATYRLQFRNGMNFARAAGLAEYFSRLGVSHLYASPLFAAVHGSTHGYDAVDVTAIEPDLGGEDGFADLSAALTEADLELLLDFVPNHMAAADANRWWRSVLEWGEHSPSARVFDIDWGAPKIILPILGSVYETALKHGDFGIAFDAPTGGFAFTCYDRRLPLTPPSYEKLLGQMADPSLAELGRRFGSVGVADSAALKRRLAELAKEPNHAAALSDMVAATSDDAALLDEIHDAQVWRLTHWHMARTGLTYRRFFEIADLICLRVEDPLVFETVHAKLFELIASGRISGVRLDHIDGLADPKSYLERFQQSVEGGAPYYLLVEKILEPTETLPRDWPVCGTTGYEFIAALAGLFVDRHRERTMTRAYVDFVGEDIDFAAAVRAAKREIFEYNLSAELMTLTMQVQALAEASGDPSQNDTDSLRRAIVALAAALPVYRSYVDASGPGAADRKLIARAARDAKMSDDSVDAAAIDFIAKSILLQVDLPTTRKAALDFTVRFQQTTGPVMAKAVEDTMYYRYNRLIALNEVGGEPERYGAPLSAFHGAMASRQAEAPGGLSATSTHDTKRGEDARARLYVLSEMPEVWQESVCRWTAMNKPYRQALSDGPVPEPAMEWLFYQSLVGAWPMDLLRIGRFHDGYAALAALRMRVLAYMEKAAREAKVHTSWFDPDANYEKALAEFVSAVLSPESGAAFLLDFVRTCESIWLAGAVNSLAQVAVKLAAPGVPDIYQGAELWDLSLVDPDNRAPVDFTVRQDILDKSTRGAPSAFLEDWTSGAPKLLLTAAGLRARTERPALFARGAYVALETTGENARHVVTFARKLDKAFAVVVVPRLVLSLIDGAERPLIPAGRWADTAVVLPEALRGQPTCDAVTGAMYEGGDTLRVADILGDFPVCLLTDHG